MSHTETHFGKLRKVQFSEGQNLEDWCREKCHDKEITEISSYNKSWKEQLQDECYEKYFFSDGEVWETFDHIEVNDGDIDLMIPNPDSTITFVLQFYNGGTCLSEMIEDGFTRLKKEGKI